MIGQVLAGHYKVEQQLGKQAGRQTLLARDLQTRQQVVIKLLSLGSDFEWQDLKLFEREAQTLKTLSHPSIPRYLDYLEIDSPNNKGFALVQTYVEGKSLEDHLKAGRTFSEAEVKQLAKSLLEILTYLHEQQPPVIHRDIKPSNILLTNRSGHSVGQVYLVDFGSVQNQAAKLGGTITVVGTYGYMPPEQFGGRATPASDLYSLGATLIYLITGRHPTELPQKDFRVQFKQVANLSLGFADWLEWMVEPSLDKRLTSAKDALQALEKPRESKRSLAVKQPPTTEIILTKNAEFIEIIIPPKGIGFDTIAFLTAITSLILFWMPLTSNTYYRFMGIVAIAIVVTFWVSSILLSLFKQIRLRIDSQQISFTNELFKWKWNRCHSAERQDIYELEFGYGFAETYEIYDEHRDWLVYDLIIKARENRYKLDKSVRLTQQEIDWLADELSNWLKLPIKKTRM